MTPRKSNNASTKRASTKRASTKRKRASTKSKRNSLMPQVSIYSKSFSYTSSPEKGEPYGKMTAISVNNGKGKKIVSLLNKNGKPFNTKTSPLKLN